MNVYDATDRINPHDIGDKPRLSAVFMNRSGVIADPTAVTVSIMTPDGETASATPTKESTGVYYYDYAITQSGKHYYRFEGTGDVIAAVEGSFDVRASKFSDD